MRTQSTGVPSVLKAGLPSGSSTSSTQRGECMVMLRAAPDRFWSGATIRTSPRGARASFSASQAGGRDAVVVGEDDQRAARLEVDEGAVPFGGHRGNGVSRS